MIWVMTAAGAAALAAAWYISRSWTTRGVVALAALSAIGAYAALGRPNMGDEPLEGRLETLERRASTEAAQFTVPEMMALLQKRAKEAPKDPNPHKFMGDLYKGAGATNEAILAYQAALRRDPDFAPAMVSLADVLFMSSGRVDESTAALYHRAFELDPGNLRVGYMAGIGDWQAGKRDQAVALWDSLEAKVSDGDPRKQMFKALRDTFAVDGDPAEAAEAAPQPQ
ncbi:MAG: hypothetical protein R3C52_05090 [Hyphomonadaceae bacterium]